MAASAIVAGDSGENAAEKEGGKLSLRMKLVTPVEEVSSDRFSLQSKSHIPESLAFTTTVMLKALLLSSRTIPTRGRWSCSQGEHS